MSGQTRCSSTRRTAKLTSNSNAREHQKPDKSASPLHPSRINAATAAVKKERAKSVSYVCKGSRNTAQQVARTILSDSISRMPASPLYSRLRFPCYCCPLAHFCRGLGMRRMERAESKSFGSGEAARSDLKPSTPGCSERPNTSPRTTLVDRNKMCPARTRSETPLFLKRAGRSHSCRSCRSAAEKSFSASTVCCGLLRWLCPSKPPVLKVQMQ